MKKFYLLTKTLLVATMLLAGASNTWAGTVQQFGSPEATSWTTSSSTTEILPGSTVTLNGVVMTFGGSTAGTYDDQWDWLDGKNSGIVSKMPNKGSNSTGYVNTDVAVGNTVPAFGGTYKFVPSKSGTLIVSGKGGGTGGNFVLVKVDGDNKITEIVKSESGTADAIDNTYNLVSGNTYYFFQCAIATGSVESGRYTLKKITYNKKMKLVDGFYYLGFSDGSYDARQKYIKIHNYNLGSLETYSGKKTKNPSSDGANLAGFSNTVTRYLIGTADTEGEYITGMTFAKSKYGWFVSSGYGLQNNDANTSANITINDATGKVAVLSHKMGADPAVEWSTVEKEEESAIFDVDGTITLSLLNKNNTKIAYTDIDVYTPCPDNVSVTFGTNGFTTFASPYPLDLTSATQTAKGFTAYRAASIAGSTVTFKDDVNQNVVANTGILLKGTVGATVYIPVAATGTALADNAFHVNTSGETFAAESGYTYYGMNKNSNPLTFGTFAPGTVAIPANKAYLKLNSSNELAARQIEANFGDEILTGISEAEAATEAVAKEGKFIVDGKLVIFKKGMKFNANGQLVK